MVERKLSKGAEELLKELHAAGHLLKPESVIKVEELIKFGDSWLFVYSVSRRFIIGLAAVLVAVGSIINFWPFGGEK